MMGTNENRPKRIAIAPGDPAGIGYEITVKALSECSSGLQSLACIVYAQDILWERAVRLFTPELKYVQIKCPEEAVHSGTVYLINSDAEFDVSEFLPGELQKACAACAYCALTMIIKDVVRGQVDGICTGPIHKGAMRLAGVKDIGHTEILANGFGSKHPMTLFLTRNLRIFFLTRHLSLREAIDALSVERVVEFGVQMHDQMKQLGFDKPVLAMAGLNPHAGDGGQFGGEEIGILIPAAGRLRELGVNITDPIGADSVFSQAASGRYDAVMALYHDQGHIAAKTYDFERTISATLGLVCLRTSVDHGTAFDIAWQGKAQSISMQTAIEALVYYMGKQAEMSFRE